MQYIEVGAGLGRIVGIDVGGEDGVTVGTVVGAGVGSVVGIVVGTAVGVVVGIASTLRFISSSANTRCADRASVRVERLWDDRATQAVFVFFTSAPHARTIARAARHLALWNGRELLPQTARAFIESCSLASGRCRTADGPVFRCDRLCDVGVLSFSGIRCFLWRNIPE